MVLHFAERIFPKFWEHRAISDGVGTIHPKPTPEQIAEGEKMLEEMKKNKTGLFKYYDENAEPSPEILQADIDEDEAIKELLGV